jgi:hypothetical protein
MGTFPLNDTKMYTPWLLQDTTYEDWPPASSRQDFIDCKEAGSEDAKTGISYSCQPGPRKLTSKESASLAGNFRTPLFLY